VTSPHFASPRAVASIDDCLFYHSMEVPGHGVVEGQWDLRPGFDEYIGGVDLGGVRVLEIGPASGFLTFTMESRGASVVSVEVTDDPGWDWVPFPEEVLAPLRPDRREVMRRLKNSWWFAHAAHGSSARVHYGSAYALPDELGEFDVALMGSVLLHVENPLRIVEQCALRANRLIIVDAFHEELEGSPVCRLHPTAQNLAWHTWWDFSTDFFRQFAEVLGFTEVEVSRHDQLYEGQPIPLFTLIASRPAAPGAGGHS
jgi:hypothetical protein